MSFKNLKSNKNTFQNLRDKVDNEGKKGFENDDRFWNPTVDKNNNGFAVIRFLPPCDGEDMPYIKVFTHSFKQANKWFIENCPTTINNQCPVCEANSELWNTGIELNKELVRKRKRKTHYVANILVLSDSKAPENEGKVFLFKFGPKIFEKVKGAINPEFEDETPFNPFDFWEGANFKLKIRNVENYRNYDKSEFETPSALFDGDDTLLEALWKKQHSLSAEISTSKFKSYEEMKKKFELLSRARTEEEFAEAEENQPHPQTSQPRSTTNKDRPTSPPWDEGAGDDNDALESFYSKLLDD